jgi:SAM-dependent methyltransferase
MRDVVHFFIRDVMARYPAFQSGCRVLEMCSYDINGSARVNFRDCEYVGVDWRPGPSVDVVTLGHEVSFPVASFDVVLSVETLEHDYYWEQTLATMYRLLRPGGLFLVTVASFNFPPHHPECSSQPEYYRNLMPGDLGPVLQQLGLTQIGYQEKYDGIFYAGIKNEIENK